MSFLIEALRGAEDGRGAPAPLPLDPSPPRLALEPLNSPPPPTRAPTESQGEPPAAPSDQAGSPPPAAYPRQALLAGLAGTTALMALAVGIGFEMRPLTRAEPAPPGDFASVAPLPEATSDHPLAPAPESPGGPITTSRRAATAPPVARVAAPENLPAPTHPGTATVIRLEQTSTNSDTATIQAHAAYLAHDLPRAEALYREALQASPNDSDAQRGLGTILALQQRWAEARRAYTQARSLSPDDPDLAYNLAVTLDQTGQLKAAATHYRQALALAAQSPAHFNLAEGSARLQALLQEPSP